MCANTQYEYIVLYDLFACCFDYVLMTHQRSVSSASYSLPEMTRTECKYELRISEVQNGCISNG